MTARAVKVAVVGGGIGGLAAAHALVRKGIDVTVHEQASRLGEIGAGVQIAPNGFRLLERYGLGDAITRTAVRFEDGSSFHRQDGTVVSPSIIRDSTGWQAVFGIHRADLLGVLSDNLPAGVVHTGHRAVRFEQGSGVAMVEFDNGDTVEADVVVGADGIHSVLRNYVTEPSTPSHSGSLAYRGLVPVSLMPGWAPGVWRMWMGESKHFLVFPVRGGSLLNYVGFVPSGESTKESWSAPGDPDMLRAEFADWDPRIVELLSHVKETFWWGLYDREPIERWSKGRLTLLGDAAHPMLPHLGQGANQSLEDGAALAVMLAGVDREEIPEALMEYERLRKERTASVQAGSRANGRRYDADGSLTESRDAEIVSSQQALRWRIYDYDAEAAAESHLQAI